MNIRKIMERNKVGNYELETREHSMYSVSTMSMTSFNSNSNSDRTVEEVPFKADYVLCYVDKKPNDKELPSKNDSSFIISKQRLMFMENLSTYGIEIETVTSTNENIYVLVRTPFNILLDVAEKLKVKLPIQENDLESLEISYTSCFAKNIEDCVSRHGSQFSENRHARNYFTAPYSSALHTKFEKFFNHEDLDKTFLPKDRIALTYEILSRTSYSELSDDPFESYENYEVDSKKGIDRLLSDGTFTQAYPLHDSYDTKSENVVINNDRQLLWEYWAQMKRVHYHQPLHIIRRYFGEKLGFYFSWLEFYTQALVLPAILGILAFTYGIVMFSFDTPTTDKCDYNKLGNLTMCRTTKCDKDYCPTYKLGDECSYHQLGYVIDNPVSLIFSIVMSLWAVVFIDLWKRKQSSLQFEWDTVDFDKSDENVRPQYEQDVKHRKLNVITGQVEPYVKWYQRFISCFVSASTVILMMAAVIIFLLAVLMYRIAVTTAMKNSTASSLVTSITAGCINLILILVLSFVYEIMAVKLTDFEHHKTDTSYEDSVAIKVYLFQFMNFYSTIFYIAFFKGQNFSNIDILNEQCDSGSCMTEVAIQMTIIMVGKQLLNNFQELFYPKLRIWYNKRRYGYIENSSLKQWEKDYKLVSWTELTLFNEYLEMVIQFGFLTLFTIVFPLGPFFALLNNVFEIRVDAINYLTDLKRPLSKRAQDIGVWIPIIDAISKIGIITNGFMIAFTSDIIERLTYTYAYGNNSLEGYVNHTLFTREILVNNVTEICHNDNRFKQPFSSDNPEHVASYLWHVYAARWAFVVAYEHVAFLLVTVLHQLIPNVPQTVRHQKEREKLLTQKALWDINRKYKRREPVE